MANIRPRNCYDPVFIFGFPRSGTSLLSRMINAHPAIAIPFESNIYKWFFARQHYYGDLSIEKNQRRLVRDILSTSMMRDWTPRASLDLALFEIRYPDFHGIVDGIFSSWTLSKYGVRTRWGEKSPNHAFYWREILDGFPEAKIVHIVRDGRDAALSLKRARFGPKHYYFLARSWVAYLEEIECIKREVGRSCMIEVRYEELLEDSDAVLKEVCQFVGESFDPKMLAFHEDSSPYPTDKENLANLAKPIMTENTEKWRTRLSENDLRIFESVAAEKLGEYGYPLTGLATPLSRAEAIRFKHSHSILRFWSMAKNVKGQLEGARLLAMFLRARLRNKLLGK